MSLLVELARAPGRQQRLGEIEPARRCRASMASGLTKQALKRLLGALPKAPHCGRMRNGSQVIRLAALSPMAPQAMKPPLTTISGLMPKKPGRHSTTSAILPGSSEPM